MYNNKLAVAIKSNGKVLREFKDTVYIKFGSEYSFLIKNLNSVRAIVKVSIDGDETIPNGLIVEPNSEVDLERWIKNGNLSEGNRFKFIERTGSIEEFRGIKIEDGLIRVEFQFERPLIKTTHTSWTQTYPAPYYNNDLRGVIYDSWCVTDSGISASATTTKASLNHNGTVVNDVGITVPGSKSEQKFNIGSWFPVEDEKHVMILKLLGETPDNRQVTESVTVKHKPKCTTCGVQNKANAKFCTQCGTALEIFA